MAHTQTNQAEITATRYRIVRKAGRCLNGGELDGGRIYHAVKDIGNFRRALCGDIPEGSSAGWASREGEKVTCPRCFRKMPTPPQPAVLLTRDFGGNHRWPVFVVGETPQKYRIRCQTRTPVRLGGRDNWLRPGEVRLVPKGAVEFVE